jgi:glycosyltransferase involved in cell wall biosynthesis
MCHHPRPPRRFLLISYFYPPHGGAGVQRALHLSRLTPDLGWDPIVLCSNAQWSTSMDPSLLDRVPESVRVERTSMISMTPIHRMSDLPGLRALRHAIPVDYLGWFPLAWQRVRRILREERIELVFSTSSPYTAHLLAERVKRLVRCPWVADFRDPWTDNNFLPFYRATHSIARARRLIDEALERRVFERADAITVTADPFRRLLCERRGLPAEKVHLVRNGFDADEFGASPPWDGARDGRSKFRLLFAGSIYGDYNLRSLFAAAELLLGRRAMPELELSVVTPAQKWVTTELDGYPLLRKQSTLQGPVSHDQVIGLYSTADVLVLACLDALSVPGKLYEYIAAGPPVLAFVAPGTDAERLLETTGAGLSVSSSDVEAGARAIERLCDAWGAGVRPARQLATIGALTRQRQAAELLAIFERLSASADG